MGVYFGKKNEGTPMSNYFRLSLLFNKYTDTLTMKEREQFITLINKCIKNANNDRSYNCDMFSIEKSLLLYEKIKDSNDKVEQHFVKYLFERYPKLSEWEEERKYLDLGSLLIMMKYKVANHGTIAFKQYQQRKNLIDNFKNIQQDLCDRINVGDVISMKDTQCIFNEIFAKYDVYTNSTRSKSLRKYGFKVKNTTKIIDEKHCGVHIILEKPQIDNE
jgi:hypothetical protein